MKEKTTPFLILVSQVSHKAEWFHSVPSEEGAARTASVNIEIRSGISKMVTYGKYYIITPWKSLCWDM